ncbi:bifunctional RNase H/acid phosphatase [Phytoactinopolyspora halotolerans]|uniref:Bifunctional RNase H/acid phosphatase n=1 Tax=Phytoactinopolyspora halotolerans TaxID=1981512 RepID=A0A6L9S9T0_9ACTN|nr:bifunctional RNase H/acid phosphatase [Phytoactinopolyspora halotolerans]NEE01996.1 bifunctional RNase H/acid phosphatase [Phytoactinopolyspora halotolerans]
MSRLIVEADGGSRGNPGPAAFGALVRAAESGAVLAEAGESIGVATNNVAEYRGLIAGLEMAYAIDPHAEVEARLDSKLVVEQMSGRWKIKHPDMRPLALRAQRIFPPDAVTYTWVPRAQNAHADRLLNDALDGTPTPQPTAEQLARGETGAGAESAVTDAGSTPPVTTRSGEAAVTPAPWSADMAPPTTLVLVRHGQTAMTRGHVFSGGSVDGPPLDEVGHGQAKRAAELLTGSEAILRLPAANGRVPAGQAETSAATDATAASGLMPGIEPPLVVASPMVRTKQTAEAVAARLGAADIVIEPEWRECEFGAWEGLTLAQISERYPDELAEWFGSTSARPPGGESLDEVAARVVAAQDRIVRDHPGQTVVVVTHSLPIRSLVRLTLEAPPTAMFRMQPMPGSVTEIQHFSDGTAALAGFNHRR